MIASQNWLSFGWTDWVPFDGGDFKLIPTAAGIYRVRIRDQNRLAYIGQTGRNFAAGMSGGIAYVLDLDTGRVNPEMVDLDPLTKADIQQLHELIRRHTEETESLSTAAILDEWPAAARRFTKVMPKDFKRVLRIRAEAEEKGMDPMVAVMGGLHG